MSHDKKDLEEKKIVENEELKQEDLGDKYSEKDDHNCSEVELNLWKDQCKRISAEFENFKKRTERDQLLWSSLAKEQVLRDFLSFVDDFDRALEQEASDNSGIKMIYQALLKKLESYNVSIMEVGKEFDPELHEAVVQVQSDDHKSGDIVSVLAKGFVLNDKVLRPAKVSVAQ